MKNYLKGQAINKDNLKQYMEEKYGKGCSYENTSARLVIGVKPLLQTDYGEDYDCTVTSMTSIMEYLSHKDVQTIYSTIEEIDKKYGYDGKRFGTNPFAINRILTKTTNALGLTLPVKWHGGYGKGIGFNYTTIIENVCQKRPMILTMLNDGRDYYTVHSVTVIGFITYRVQNKLQRFLIIYDNWHNSVSYIDYEILPFICSLNHYQ